MKVVKDNRLNKNVKSIKQKKDIGGQNTAE